MDSASVRVRLELVAMLDEPVALAARRGDPALYLAEKSGRVVAIRDGRVDAAPVLDLSKHVSLGAEQGLLGVVFSPDGRFLYVNYTDRRGDTKVVEAAIRGGAVDRSTLRAVLSVHQPFTNHNGGHLAFGPDGFLYIGLGDGGSAGDPRGNAQSLTSLLGKILRIDPRPAGGRPYGVPPDNPFVHRVGARAEIWASGLRNPWRYSFDRATGDLWIGDVGQFRWEEVDLQPAASEGGENYGWNALEGAHPYGSADAPEGAIDPVFEYDHASSGGCGVIGGFVYRGGALPPLVGAYVYSDLCHGRLEALRLRDGHVQRIDLGRTVQAVSSFGEDGAGELYVLSLAGGVYRLRPAPD
ncbi:MAG: PQQ-dependent sugar dehydrogenase [Actinomycetota bacterium]